MPVIDTEKNEETKATIVEAIAHMSIAKAHVLELMDDGVLPRATSRAFKHLTRAMEILKEAIRTDSPNHD